MSAFGLLEETVDEDRVANDEDIAEDEAIEEEAAAGDAALAEEEADADGEEDEGEQVEEHLKDAVEGSLRLKRMLEGQEPGAKRTKTNGGVARPAEDALVHQLLTKWQLTTDTAIKHVLDDTTLETLQSLINNNFTPDKTHKKKTPAEFVAAHLQQTAERKISPCQQRCDLIAAFRHRWGLDSTQEQTLRLLNHRDLRYVITNFDNTALLEDVVSEANLANVDPQDDEPRTIRAAPQRPGLRVMGRFNRLELIDPLADCAVFGDANLTFSMNLAKHRTYLGHVGRVIATTFEEIDTLRERYKEIDESIKLLEDHDAEVYHGVDCTRIALDKRFEGIQESLGAVYYNFPHSGAIQGFFDGHPLVNWRHENLMRLFFRALRYFVKPGGVVKVSSNANALGVRYSYIVGSALENEFLHQETMPFLEWHLHRYGRSYGDRRDLYKRLDASNNQSYNAQNGSSDMVYCFCYAPTGKKLAPQFFRNPPTLDTLRNCRDGPFQNLAGNSKVTLANQMHERFLTEISGVHVG